MISILEYFDKQNIYSQTSVISLAILMPFWYISLFLINPILFFSIDLILRIVLSFCFSVSMYFMSFFFIVLSKELFKQNTDKIIHDHLVLAGAFCVLCICGTIMGSIKYKISKKDKKEAIKPEKKQP